MYGSEKVNFTWYVQKLSCILLKFVLKVVNSQSSDKLNEGRGLLLSN